MKPFPKGMAFLLGKINSIYIWIMLKHLQFIFLIFIFKTASAQEYTINGNSSRENCHCYQLTPNAGTQSGSVWNNNKIDLTNSFNFVFTINLGCNDAGADGIVFVLQPISTSVGSTGNGLGFGGISPSIGVTLDTYQNGNPDNDPSYDHIAIQQNGDITHNSANNLAGPIQILSGSDNIEDCTDHTLRIKWNATTKLFETFIDEIPRLSITKDLVNTTFGGNPMVFWGFTGSTGGAYNLQRFCTALNPAWNYLPDQKRCVGESITFKDATVSFTTLADIFWDFGDGSPISQLQNPTHTYTQPGDYTVKQRVIGADGCEEIFSSTLRVGSYPIADFKIMDSCVNSAIQFTDLSTVAVGTINKWDWIFDNNTETSTLQNPSSTFSTYGEKNIKLTVTTLEGCASTQLIKPIKVRSTPIVDFSFNNKACLTEANIFQGNITIPDGLPIDIAWTFGNEGNSTLPNPQFTFTVPGDHIVKLVATVSPNCPVALEKTVSVIQKPIAVIEAAVICEGQPHQWKDASTTLDAVAITKWWWDLGNGTISTQKDPTTTYTTSGDYVIRHYVENASGCVSPTVEYRVTVLPKPIAKIKVGDLTCQNDPVILTDITSSPNDPIATWEWKYNNAIFGNQQVVEKLFPSGNNTVSLIVTSTDGCISAAAIEMFTVKTTPQIQFSSQDACKLSPVQFVASETNTTIGIDKWIWNFGDGATSNEVAPIHTYTQNGNYKVQLSGISTEGCPSETLTAYVNIYGTNAFAGNDTLAAAGEPIQLHASGGLSYEWLTGTGFLSNPNIANPVATLTQTQTFTLKAFTPEGCESYDDITVKIYKGPDMYLPTAFTPNRDGLNDVYRGVPVGIKQFNFMRIYNRWGQLMFETTTLNKGWDGRYKGAEQLPGTYVVMMSCIDFRGKLIQKKSTFQLIK